MDTTEKTLTEDKALEPSKEKKTKEKKDKKQKPEKKAKAVKYPTKTSINLARDDDRNKRIAVGAVSVVLVIAAAACVAKFGVIDQYDRRNAAEAQYNDVHTVYLSTQEAVNNYDAIQAEYRTYSMKWIYEDDSGRYVSVDRQLVLDLLQNELMNWGTVSNFTVSGETMSVEMSGMSLSEISEMLIMLDEYPIVSSVSLGTTTSEADTGDLSFALTIQLQPEPEEEEAAQ